MKKAFAVGILALAAGACGGPDSEYFCEQTYECNLGGMDIPKVGGVDLVEACADAFDNQLDECKGSVVDAIDKAIEDCKPKKGCAFQMCLATKQGLADECLIPEQPPSECGDDWADPDEDCDESDLDGEDCYSQTGGEMPGGTLTCTDDCTFDTSGCTSM